MPDSTFTRAAVRVQTARASKAGPRISVSIFALLALSLFSAPPALAGTRISPDSFWIPDNFPELTVCEAFFTVTNRGRLPARFLKRGFEKCAFNTAGVPNVIVESDAVSICPDPLGLLVKKFGPTNDGAYLCWYRATTACRSGYRRNSRGQCFPEEGIVEDKQPSLCPLQPPGPVSGSGSSASLAAGNPINLATASKYQRELDYRSAGAFPLTFVRHYNSRVGMEAASMGPKWRHHYDRSVEINATSGGRSAYVFRADGRVVYFNDDLSSDAWISDSDVEASFSEQTDAAGETTGFTYVTEADVVESYDSEGRLVAITNREGFQQALTYDAGGRLVGVTGPFGRAIAFTYDADNRISALVDPAGEQYRYAYDAAGRLSRLIFPDETPADPDDNPFREYVYEDPDFPEALTGIVDANGDRFATWSYDDQGRAVSSAHAGGADRTEITYNTDGSVTVTDALDTVRTYQVEVVLGVAKAAAIDEPCSQCAGQSSSASFDGDGYPASRTDFNGNVTTFVYDERGLETSRTEAAGAVEARTLETEWHPVLRRPAKITVPGRETAFTYDAAGRLLARSVTDTGTDEGAARTVLRSYNSEGLLAAIDGPRTDVADVTRFEYDAAGNLERTANALGHVTEITYDAHGRPVLLVDPNGVRTALQYDARGRLVSRDVAGSTTRFEYDAVGNVTRVTLPDGSFIAQEYDAAHRLIAMSDNLGNRTAYTLDAIGNRTVEKILDPLGALTRTRSRVYDHLNRLTEEIGGEGQSTRFAYDPQGNLITGTDPNGEPTASSYDSLNRLVATLAPDDGITGFVYDARDNLTEVTDPRGLTTVFTYNGFDEVVETSSPDTGLTLQTYDEAGNRRTSTDARGITAGFEYDVLNRLTAIRYPDPGENVTFTYDEGLNGIGRLTRIDDEAGTTAMAYDARGNLVNDIRTIDGIEYETRYHYDPADRLVQMTYPSGLVVDYHRDALGRVAEVTAVIDGETRTVASGLEYAPFGPMTGLTYGNGIQMTRTLDGDYRLLRQTAGTIQDLGFQYDPAGNILAIADGTDPARDQIFGYDPVNRLTAAEGIYGTRAYTYDRVGNRLSRTADGALDQYGYSASANQLVSIDGPNAQEFTYNTVGNTVQKGPQEFIYNDANRLASVLTSSELVARYTYNAKGERVKKSVAGAETTLFHYDSAGNLLAEFAADGSHQRDYLWLEGESLAIVAPASGPDLTFTGTNGRIGDAITVGLFLDEQTVEIQNSQGSTETYTLTEKQWKLGKRGLLRLNFKGAGVRIAGILKLDTLKGFLVTNASGRWRPYRLEGEQGEARPEGLFFIHGDQLGTPKVISDEDQGLVWKAEHAPFGTAFISVEVVENNLRFPGQYSDQIEALLYNKQRFMDPITGRYVSSDRLGLEAGINTYIYALQNPIRFTDPTGEIIPALIACAVNPICSRAVRAGVGALIGGLSALAAATNDPCFDGNLSRVIISGAVIGAATSLIPGSGATSKAFIRGGAAGIGGNSAGQVVVNKGVRNFNPTQAAVSGAIGGTSLAAGNIAGFNAAIIAARSPSVGTARALATGESIGNSFASGIETSSTLIRIGLNRSRTGDCICE